MVPVDFGVFSVRGVNRAPPEEQREKSQSTMMCHEEQRLIRKGKVAPIVGAKRVGCGARHELRMETWLRTGGRRQCYIGHFFQLAR